MSQIYEIVYVLQRRIASLPPGEMTMYLEEIIDDLYRESRIDPARFNSTLEDFWIAHASLEGNIPKTDTETGFLLFRQSRTVGWKEYRIACENLVKSVQTYEQWTVIQNLGTNVRTRGTKKVYQKLLEVFGEVT